MIPNHTIDSLIMNKASSLFTSYGIKSVSMDSIASSCKISKKTIYKHFKTKELLLHKIVLATFLENTLEFENLIYTETIFQSLELIFKAVEKIYVVITPIFIVETKTNFKNIYDLITHLELVNLKNNLQKIIHKGRSQDIFNNILDDNFSIEIYFNFLHNLINESNSSIYRHNQIKCVNNYFLYSLLSPKGLQIQTEFFKDEIGNK